MRHQLEQRIHTLAENVIDTATVGVTGYSAEGVQFSPWKIDPSDGYWTHHYWIAKGEIDANDFRNAWRLFWSKLARIVPRISLVSQCYAEYLTQPILILRKDFDTAFLQDTVDREGGRLMFMDQQHKALNLLLTDSQIPHEFFLYWNDATNSSGYASKLVLMFSAVEALVKIETGRHEGKNDFAKLERILGPELKKDLWGTKEENTNALRHRLIHGEYFHLKDGQKNYLVLMHKRIIAYLNEVIFKEKLIAENVVNPQRHPHGNYGVLQSFIRPVEGAKLALAQVIADMVSNGNFTQYEWVVDNQLRSNY